MSHLEILMWLITIPVVISVPWAVEREVKQRESSEALEDKVCDS